MLNFLQTDRDFQLRMPGLPGRGPGKGGAGKSGSGSRRPAKGKTVRAKGSAKGATPKVVSREKPSRSPAVWFNRLLILTGTVVVLAAAIEAYITLQSIPVQRISVTGELANTRYEEVQEMVQPALAGGFLNADLQRIRTQLEALPWIYEANVRRKWPNALEIHVVEQLPIARWGSDGFLNHEGDVFRSEVGDQWQSLPLLQGPRGTAPALVANYQRLVDLLRPLGLQVERLAVDRRGQVEATLAGGVQLLLGGEEFIERMQRFVALYRGELAVRFDQVQRIDLRYANGVAVAFDPLEQVADVSEK
jgi:cell division protein FtsQ